MTHRSWRRRVGTVGALLLASSLGLTLVGCSKKKSEDTKAKAEKPEADATKKKPQGDRFADGQKLDKNWQDFDIVEAAVYAVLDAKPASPVGLVADGSTRLTVFVPTDAAFRSFVRSIKGFAPKTEAKTLAQVVKIAGSIDTVETILLYHVIAGKTLTSPKVVAAEGDKLTTAQGGAFRVHIGRAGVSLVDKDRDAANPYVVVLDINRGNKQVAHGINRVLRPLDL